MVLCCTTFYFVDFVLYNIFISPFRISQVFLCVYNVVIQLAKFIVYKTISSFKLLPVKNYM